MGMMGSHPTVDDAFKAARPRGTHDPLVPTVGAALAAGDTRRAWCPRACPAATDGAIEESKSSAECCKDGNSERLINPAFRFPGGATGAGAGVIVTLRFHPAKVEFVYGNRGFKSLRLRSKNA